MVNYQGASLEEQVKILLEQNLAYAKETYHLTKKIKRHFMIGRVFSLLGLLIFVVLPIILGVAFLPRFFKNTFGGLLPGGSTAEPAGGAFQTLLESSGFSQQEIMDLIQQQGGLPNLLKKLNSAGQN